jgi:c-di-GMP-binding flagellar brake protein YcgR
MAGKLLSKYVMSGNKVEIRKTARQKLSGEKPKVKVYLSQVYDILSEDRIEIIMPTEKTKIVLLPVGAEYDLHFYSTNGVYQCRARVVDRGKRNNVFLLVMELTSNLTKDQRREFYRFSCALEMNSRALDGEEVEKLENDGMLDDMLSEGESLKQSIIVDISGGGLRFVSAHAYDKESIILCKYELDTGKGVKEYEILGKVLNVQEVQTKNGLYEHRVQYIDIEDGVREEIIQYIFETERKNRKKKK